MPARTKRATTTTGTTTAAAMVPALLLVWPEVESPVVTALPEAAADEDAERELDTELPATGVGRVVTVVTTVVGGPELPGEGD